MVGQGLDDSGGDGPLEDVLTLLEQAVAARLFSDYSNGPSALRKVQEPPLILAGERSL